MWSWALIIFNIRLIATYNISKLDGLIIQCSIEDDLVGTPTNRQEFTMHLVFFFP